MKTLTEKQKLIIMIASAVMVLAVVTCILLIRLGTPIPRTSDGKRTSEPYRMMVDGKEVLLVKNRAEGIAALSDVVKEYTPKGMTTTRVDFDKKITFEEKEIKPFQKLTTVLSEEEAAEHQDRIIKSNTSGNKKRNINKQYGVYDYLDVFAIIQDVNFKEITQPQIKLRWWNRFGLWLAGVGRKYVG